MISASKFYTILNTLKRKGLVQEHVVNLGGRGGITTFIEITSQGCEAIGVKPKPHLTRGGSFVTDILVDRASSHLKNILPDWKINIEKQIENKWTDIVAEAINEQFVLAIEIEMTEANLESNIQKDIEKVDFLIMACLNEQIADKAEEIIKILPEEKQKKIAICLLSKLLKCERLSEVVKSDILRERGC